MLRNILTLCILSLSLFVSIFTYAAEPQPSLSFQGQLFDNNIPASGSVSATFTFYDAPTSGSSTGSTINKTLTVSNGYFSTTFTPSDTTGVNFNQQLYLEVSINGTPLSPRTTITPTVSSLKTLGTFSYTAAPTVGPTGSLYFNTTSNELYVSTGSAWVPAGTSTSSAATLTGTTGQLAFFSSTNTVSGTSSLFIAPNGNVGVGTTTPGSTLTVIGDMNATTFSLKGLGFKTNTLSNSLFVGTNAGYGATNANRSSFIGQSAGYDATGAEYSNFFGYSAGDSATSASYSNFFGVNAGAEAINAANSNFIGGYAGYGATDANYSNFFGESAGAEATGAFSSNFFGESAGSNAVAANHSNFIGQSAGEDATNAANSNFFGLSAGQGAISAQYSNFLGQQAGSYAENASFSNFIGYQAGYAATNAADSIFIGRNSGLSDTVNNTAGDKSSILLGNYTSTGGFSNSIAIGQGVANSAVEQLNIGNVLYATGISSSTTPSATPLSGGRFGIGTSTPTDTLSIAGSLNLTGAFKTNGNAGTSGMVLQTTGTGVQWVATSTLGISGGSTLTGTTGQFAFFSGTNTVSGTSTLFLNSGRVGVGTASPSADFTVYQSSTGASGGFRFTGNSIGGVSSGSGFLMSLGFNSVTNKQLWLGDPDYIGNSNSSFLRVVSGTGYTYIDAVDGSATVVRDLILSPVGGNVGIGTYSPSAKFTTTGTVRFASLGSGGANLITDSLGNVTVSSDERLKDIQGVYESGLAQLKNIQPISYKWKTETGYDTVNSYAGFSAQNVKDNLPEAVTEDSRGFLTLADRPILAALVNGVKELATKIEGFKDKFTTKELCLEDVCITKDQLRVLLQNANQQSNTSAPASTSTPDPVSVSTDPVIPDNTAPEEILAPESEVVVPPPAPEPEPVVDAPPAE